MNSTTQNTTQKKTITLSVTIPIQDLTDLTDVSADVILSLEAQMNEYWTGYFVDPTDDGKLAGVYDKLFAQMVTEVVAVEEPSNEDE